MPHSLGYYILIIPVLHTWLSNSAEPCAAPQMAFTGYPCLVDEHMRWHMSVLCLHNIGHNIEKDYKLSINERLKAIIIWLLAKGKCLLLSYSKNILLQPTKKQSLKKVFTLGWGGFWLMWKTINRMETLLPNKLWQSEYWTCDVRRHYQIDRYNHSGFPMTCSNTAGSNNDRYVCTVCEKTKIFLCIIHEKSIKIFN